VKATTDLGTSAVSQMLAERMLGSDGSVWSARAPELRRRYQVLDLCLREQLGAWRFDEPAGGLSLWVSLGGVDAERFARPLSATAWPWPPPPASRCPTATATVSACPSPPLRLFSVGPSTACARRGTVSLREGTSTAPDGRRDM